MSQRVDPCSNYNFVVEIDGIAAAAFEECSGLAASVDIIEYREGADKRNVPRKLPGLAHFSNIVLKRGITTNRDLWQWFKDILNGVIDRRNVAVVLLDSQRQPVVRWMLTAAFPAKWEGPALKGKGTEVAIETLELAHEGLDWAD
jgi:phage tail-like protein